MTASSKWFIGGVNRWLLDFEWLCSASALGGPLRAKLEVGLIQPLPTPIDETNRTFYFQRPQTLDDYEVRTATIWLQGSGVPELKVDLNPTSSFLSVRREGSQLIGGVHYVGEGPSNMMATMAGPFEVPVPQQ